MAGTKLSAMAGTVKAIGRESEQDAERLAKDRVRRAAAKDRRADILRTVDEIGARYLESFVDDGATFRLRVLEYAIAAGLPPLAVLVLHVMMKYGDPDGTNITVTMNTVARDLRHSVDAVKAARREWLKPWVTVASTWKEGKTLRSRKTVAVPRVIEERFSELVGHIRSQKEQARSDSAGAHATLLDGVSGCAGNTADNSAGAHATRNPLYAARRERKKDYAYSGYASQGDGALDVTKDGKGRHPKKRGEGAATLDLKGNREFENLLADGDPDATMAISDAVLVKSLLEVSAGRIGANVLSADGLVEIRRLIGAVMVHAECDCGRAYFAVGMWTSKLIGEQPDKYANSLGSVAMRILGMLKRQRYHELLMTAEFNEEIARLGGQR